MLENGRIRSRSPKFLGLRWRHQTAYRKNHNGSSLLEFSSWQSVIIFNKEKQGYHYICYIITYVRKCRLLYDITDDDRMPAVGLCQANLKSKCRIGTPWSWGHDIKYYNTVRSWHVIWTKSTPMLESILFRWFHILLLNSFDRLGFFQAEDFDGAKQHLFEPNNIEKIKNHTWNQPWQPDQ